MSLMCNLHTHTDFCDGKNSVEEMVLDGIGAGMKVLGFSSHSPLPFENDWCMTDNNIDDYISAVLKIRQKYCDKIEIPLGIELDILSKCDVSKFDYVIGSVHCVKCGGEYISVDESSASLEADVKRFYAGNYYELVYDYYKNMYELSERTKCDIVGHFDLVTKFNEGNKFFDTGDAKYRNASLEALDFLLEKELIFEINTGAVARGYRSFPYPEDFVLKRIAERRGRVILGSDAHSVGNLMFGFSDALEYIKSIGFDKLTVMRNGVFEEVGINC